MNGEIEPTEKIKSILKVPSTDPASQFTIW